MFYPLRRYLPWAQSYTFIYLTAPQTSQMGQIHKRTPKLTSPKIYFQSSHPNKFCNSTKHLIDQGRNLGAIILFSLLYFPHPIHHQILIILNVSKIYLSILSSLSYPNSSHIFHQDCCHSFFFFTGFSWFLLFPLVFFFPVSSQPPPHLATQIYKVIF